MPSLLETFRTLASFDPPRVSLRDAPWDAYVDWAVAQGLAPIAAYNLEYRMAGADAPEWVRDRLLSIYQGTLNDNVMKLVNFKRAVDELEGRRVLLLGGAAFAEALYPHVAFRPVAELELLLPADDVAPFANYLGQAEFRLEESGSGHAPTVLSDGRTPVLLWSNLRGTPRVSLEKALFERALPMRVYGPSLYRPSHVDAVLLCVWMMARHGFEVPFLSWVDLRELLLGAPSLGGPYSQPLDTAAVRALAHEWRIDRALFAAASIVGRLFPRTEAIAAALRPALRAATRSLLDRWVIEPASRLGELRTPRGAERVRRWLTGG